MVPDAGPPVRVEVSDEGALWRVVLARPKGNVLDREMVAALTGTCERARTATGLKALILAGEGAHFSFGASVQEHLPEHVAEMLHGFHGLIRALGASHVPLLAAVRGQCLGGGLEVAMVCHRVFASPDAKLGQPEIRLGVFAPVASVVLPDRIGRPAAEDLLLSGRTIDAETALALGLVDELAEDPEAAALAYAREHLLPKSAIALRMAERAARAAWWHDVSFALDAAERLYLDELMATADAREGIAAFLAKRQPRWSDR